MSSLLAHVWTIVRFTGQQEVERPSIIEH